LCATIIKELETMLSAQEIILQYVCPALGMIAANFMFAGESNVNSVRVVLFALQIITYLKHVTLPTAPFKDVRQAVSNGTLGNLNPTPWAFMTGNCCGWVTYSYLIQVRR
jgi:solute carrier family 50 protein (sugar transporter)